MRPKLFNRKKAAGALTKMVIGSILFGLLFAILLSLMVNLSNNTASYPGVTIETTYTTSDYFGAAMNQSAKYLNYTQVATINQNVPNTAQVQGSISAESSKQGGWSVVVLAINDFGDIYSIDSRITYGILGIGLAILGAAIYYALLKIVP